MRARELAICLKTTDFSETSQVVHFFTRASGVARLLAKGTKRAKSKSGGAIDLLSEGDLVFSTSGRETLGTLMEFTETVTHQQLRKDAAKLNAALYMIELVGDSLAEADPHPEAFDLLHNALARLEQADSRPLPVLAYFQWRLLKLIGLLGELRQCVSCGEALLAAPVADGTPANPPRDVYFSSSHGGLLCGGCEMAAAEKYRLDEAALTGLSLLMAAERGRRLTMPDAAARSVNRLLAYHFSHQLGRPLKMARYAIG